MYSGFISAVKAENHTELAELSLRMTRFYSQADLSSYWGIADSANFFYDQVTHPYHCDLLQRIATCPGDIVDLGCGSAHILRHLGVGARYTGIDWSDGQISENQKRYPNARFRAASVYESGLPDGSYDWVVSFYVLEHCVYPQRLLAEMVRLLKPGGRAAIICPHFRPYPMNSMWYGRDSRPTREKVKNKMWLDCIRDLWERKVLFPIKLRTEHDSSGQFLIYRDLRCFHADYSSDRDACYWTYSPEIVTHLKDLGAGEVEWNQECMGSPVKRAIYLIVKKNA